MITIALASPALSQSGSGTINRRHVVGCRDRDVYDRIISMISAGNREAATALIARMLGTGECIIWDEGQRVRPEELLGKGGQYRAVLLDRERAHC